MLITRSPLLLIVSGPAGSGKTTLCDRLCSELANMRRVITATTRPPRTGEQNGVDYYFLEESTFEQNVRGNAFYEHAHVHDRRYGTLKSEIKEKFEMGNDLVLNIDVQGAASFRSAKDHDSTLAQRLVSAFIGVTDLEELQRRMEARGKDRPEEIARRLKNAKNEFKEWHHFDYFIDSQSKEEDFQRIKSIYITEKLNTQRCSMDV